MSDLILETFRNQQVNQEKKYYFLQRETTAGYGRMSTTRLRYQFLVKFPRKKTKNFDVSGSIFTHWKIE